MKFGILKPGKKIYMNPLNEAEFIYTSYNVEIKNLIKVLMSAGHEVVILSDSDQPSSMSDRIGIDYVILFNGIQDKFVDDYLISNLRCPVIYMQTDLALDWYSKFLTTFAIPNIHLTQNTSANYEDEYYFPSEQLITVGATIHNSFSDRKDHIIYVGNERDLYRTRIIKEFLIDNIPDKARVWGNWPSFRLSKVKNAHANTLMQLSKFAFVCCDESYSKLGFVTQRYWEGILNGCINLLHKEYDKFNTLDLESSYYEQLRTIYTPEDLVRTLNILCFSKTDAYNLLEMQSNQITEDMRDGTKFSKLFTEIIDDAKR